MSATMQVTALICFAYLLGPVLAANSCDSMKMGSLNRDSSDCACFFNCTIPQKPIHFQCPRMHLFDKETSICRPFYEVSCDAPIKSANVMNNFGKCKRILCYIDFSKFNALTFHQSACTDIVVTGLHYFEFYQSFIRTQTHIISDMKILNRQLRIIANVDDHSTKVFMNLTKARGATGDLVRATQMAIAGTLRNFTFDGLLRDITNSDATTIETWVKEVSALFKEEQANSGLRKLDLLLKGPAMFDRLNYSPKTLAPFVDAFVYEATDFQGSTPSKTASMTPSALVDQNLNAWVSAVGKDKVIMAIPFYGAGYTLRDPKMTGIGAEIEGPAPSPISKMMGSIPYPEICLIASQFGAKKVSATDTDNTYVYKDNFWMTYEDPGSIVKKVMKYREAVAGFALKHITDDDVLGFCGRSYELLRTVLRACGGNDPFM
ncbi:chitinase-3-like protein 1 isoform X3 [Biomphalaria pfeifferi]|uniref:Chitinase-3-like protein 1 isoform X3 n=1 Tax=Biomphalaria pfeifferi TaxID=112525 RepID=A0AAD8FML1_BIOPF|nr:chitinase-3-like protein 1 isoform X3 [Biomphalaria pfeifferi]